MIRAAKRRCSKWRPEKATKFEANFETVHLSFPKNIPICCATIFSAICLTGSLIAINTKRIYIAHKILLFHKIEPEIHMQYCLTYCLVPLMIHFGFFTNSANVSECLVKFVSVMAST